MHRLSDAYEETRHPASSTSSTIVSKKSCLSHKAALREGYQWSPSDGLQQGLPTVAAINPPTSNRGSHDFYDVIVIGSGYAGLTAARDLAVAGASVMLLEARDRIGGRTWTAKIEGHNFEIGGTYVHRAQPNLWREVARYQMQKDIDAAVDMEKGVTEISMITPAGLRVMTQEEQTALFASAFGKFINVDDGQGRYIMPYPHNPGFVPDAAGLDQMTLKDRLNQVHDDLTEEESTMLEALLVVLSGAKPEEAGLYDLVRLWALCGYSIDGLIALCSLFKLHDGQSGFARKFFEEARATKKLYYAFDCPVASISDNGQGVEVKCINGDTLSARRVICTIPHNVLSSINFDPPLCGGQKDVLHTPHVNKSLKVHAEVQPPELRTWMGMNYPTNKLIQAAGEAITPAGNARLVCFGAATNPLQPEEDVDGTVAALKACDGKDRIQVNRLVFTNWGKDEYARGGWSWLPPLMGTMRDLGVLRQGHGNVLFANADWAVGWRGFIDGAIEEGARAAKAVRDELLATIQ